MQRTSSRIVLWTLAVVVVVLAVISVNTIMETSDAREQRCEDVVNERRLDRLLWFSILGRVEGVNNRQIIEQFREDVDRFKPPLRCDRRNIPVTDTTPEEP